MRPHWRMPLALTLALAAAPLACGGVISDGEDLEGERTVTSSSVLTGEVKPSASWKTHQLKVDAPCELRLQLDWDDPQADLNLFLYDPSGDLVAYANGATQRPERVTLKEASAGGYTVAVKGKSGSARYRITVEQVTAGLDLTFKGKLSQAASWTRHKVELSSTGTLSVQLDWNDPQANLNVFLYDPQGKLVAYANDATQRPERLTHDVTSAGSWSVGIKCKAGATSYTLRVTQGAQATTPPPPAPATPSYPGQPKAGTLYWGAAVSGNGDPSSRHEKPSGAPLSIRRTFFQWAKSATSMVNMAKNDLAAGRLPWVSTKTPSWSEMGAGKHDAAIDKMLKALDALPGPVWLTMHHEPEGGGGKNYPDDPAGPAGHLAMNKRVRQRMTALGVDNVALVPILMSYTWNKYSKRDPEQWWAPGVYDFLGVDHYQNSQASLENQIWSDVRAWAKQKGVEIAVGEWGMRGTDAAAGQRMQQWYNMAAGSHSDGKGARVVGLCAFDSDLNSPSGSWELAGAQLTTFHKLLGDPRTASVFDYVK